MQRLSSTGKPIEESEGVAEESPKKSVSGIPAEVVTANQHNNQTLGKTGTFNNQDVPIPGTLKGIKEIMGDRLVIASVGGSSPPKVEKKDTSKGIKL